MNPQHRLDPTTEQLRILQSISDGINCVVIASPGSGKTQTLAMGVRQILPPIPHYSGVIAISFTNRASLELERRTLEGGVDPKGSFFGTIDKFYLTEIIIPFARHIYGEPTSEFEIEKLEELGNSDPRISRLKSEIETLSIDELMTVLGSLYVDGRILLGSIGQFANYVFEHSFACTRYLAARYSQIIVDEYQDCGSWQHSLFIKLVELGIQGIAVGDINQSIFAFANKEPRYLIELSQANKGYRVFSLSKNHRSHPSITDYSTRLLSGSFEPSGDNEFRVYSKVIEGSEVEIAQWLEIAVPHYVERFNCSHNRVAILVRNRRTGNLIHKNISFPHKPISTTLLDNDSSIWASVFRKMLYWVFSEDMNKYELLETYLSMEQNPHIVRESMATLSRIEKQAQSNPDGLRSILPAFIEFAETMYPLSTNQGAISNLKSVLTTSTSLESFIPAARDEVLLMTMHMAKGLEFDVVFLLDLYRWIMPMYRGDYIQDLNLHYVGITRAKECAVLCTSTRRHNNDGMLDAEPSEFLELNGLSEFRNLSPV